MRGANNRAQIVRIFHAIQHHDQRGMRGDIFQLRILLFRAQRNDSLVGFHARQTVHRGAIFEANRRAGAARQIDDFLHASAPQSARDEHAFERALRAQSFSYGVKTNENGQARLSRGRVERPACSALFHVPPGR